MNSIPAAQAQEILDSLKTNLSDQALLRLARQLGSTATKGKSRHQLKDYIERACNQYIGAQAEA